ncbi:Blue-light photoreceptor [Symbiodinium microadriaticum]|uniref:Blue-light photoreceptor n=1 Tax=Symbiodinium microadriaticum TaxID=2951 RepID=A0A1Q9DHD8_SYMMI|nr:Blue-light photoreceptor [Symbiodinium microadriaticum]
MSQDSDTAGDLQQHLDETLARIESDVTCVVVRSIRDCNFSVSIADPAQPDCPLISVSEGFCELTGYDRETILGQNCRFLNDGCDIQPSDRQGLRVSAKTGKHFCGVLKNLKADGTPFLNLLDMRGLSVGRTKDGEERFFIVGIQADVSEQGSEELPLEHKTQMQYIATLVRDELSSGLQQEAIVTASAGDDVSRTCAGSPEPSGSLGVAALASRRGSNVLRPVVKSGFFFDALSTGSTVVRAAGTV